MSRQETVDRFPLLYPRRRVPDDFLTLPGHWQPTGTQPGDAFMRGDWDKPQLTAVLGENFSGTLFHCSEMSLFPIWGWWGTTEGEKC